MPDIYSPERAECSAHCALAPAVGPVLWLQAPAVVATACAERRRVHGLDSEPAVGRNRVKQWLSEATSGSSVFERSNEANKAGFPAWPSRVGRWFFSKQSQLVQVYLYPCSVLRCRQCCAQALTQLQVHAFLRTRLAQKLSFQKMVWAPKS